MKNTFRVLTFVGAVALLLGLLVSGSSTVAAQATCDNNCLGTVTFSTNAYQEGDDLVPLEYGTNDQESTGSIIGVRLEDVDLADSSRNPESTTVRVVSGSDSAGFDLVLQRTRSLSGDYVGTFVLATSTMPATSRSIIIDSSSDRSDVEVPTIRTKHGDKVRVTYTDMSVALGSSVGIPNVLTVDTKGPVFSGLTPADGTISKTAAQTYAVTAKDTDSGVDESSPYGFLISTAETSSLAGVNILLPLVTAEAKEGNTKVGITFSIPLSISGNIWVSAEVRDNAGNTAQLDTDLETDRIDPARIIIDTDPPTIDQIYTGVGYDTTKPKELTRNKRNSLLVVFADPGNLTELDAASVTRGDFSVAGHAIGDASVFPAATATSTIQGLATLQVGLAVFLTLEADLGPGDKPGVTVIGQVADEAGNAHISTGAVAPVDRIGPSFAVSDITPTLAGKDDTVTFAITSDESLSTDKPDTVNITNLQNGVPLSRTVTASGTNRWEVKTSRVTGSGTYSIYVAGSDSADNIGSAGDAGTATTTVGSSKIIEFEADVSLRAPDVTPANESKTTTRDPFFITIDFAATTNSDGVTESNEFVGDSSKTVDFDQG